MRATSKNTQEKRQGELSIKNRTKFTCCASPWEIPLQRQQLAKLHHLDFLGCTYLLGKTAYSCLKKSFCGGVHAVWTSLNMIK